MAVQIQQNEAIVRRHIDEVVNNGRSEVIPELYAQDVTYHDPFTPGGEGHGIEAITEFIVATKRAFPDFHFTVDHLFGDGDTVAWRGIATGTHLGDFPGLPASGKAITLPMCQIFRFTDGKIKELWVFTDSLSLVKQVSPSS